MQPGPPRDPSPDPSPNPPRDPSREQLRLQAERPYRQRLPKALTVPRRVPGLPARENRPARPTGGRTVVAVLGSVAALGGSAATANAATAPSIPSRSGQQAARATRRADPAPPGELALLGLVFAALTAGAPAIAGPLLGRGVAAGDITQAEADAFLARLISASEDAGSRDGSGREGSTREGALAYEGLAQPTPAAVTLFRTIFDAIRRQLPVIAKPVVADAVGAGTITVAQARRIEERLVVRAHLRPAAALPSGGGGHVEPLFTGRLP